jgi:hypothetical protein
LEPHAIDRLSQTLVHVQPRLEQVSTPQTLRNWADALIDKAADELVARPVGDRLPRTVGGNVLADAHRVCDGGAMGLCEWERALVQTLSRLQTSGSLSGAADPTTLGSAFAALLYGGLLLGQASRDAAPLRAAMDMALSQVDEHAQS